MSISKVFAIFLESDRHWTTVDTRMLSSPLLAAQPIEHREERKAAEGCDRAAIRGRLLGRVARNYSAELFPDHDDQVAAQDRDFLVSTLAYIHWWQYVIGCRPRAGQLPGSESMARRGYVLLCFLLAWLTAAGWTSNIVVTALGRPWPIVPGLMELSVNQKPTLSFVPLLLSHSCFVNWLIFTVFVVRMKRWHAASAVRCHDQLSPEVKEVLRTQGVRHSRMAIAFAVVCTVGGIIANFVTYVTVVHPWREQGVWGTALDTVITVFSFFIQFAGLGLVAAEFSMMALFHEVQIAQLSMMAARGAFSTSQEITIAHHSTVCSIQMDTNALQLGLTAYTALTGVASLIAVGLYLMDPCAGCWLRFFYLLVIITPVAVTLIRASSINSCLANHAHAICYLQSIAYAPQCLLSPSRGHLLTRAMAPDLTGLSPVCEAVLVSSTRKRAEDPTACEENLAGLDWNLLFAYYSLWSANGRVGFSLFGVLLTRGVVVRLFWLVISSGTVLLLRATRNLM